MGNKRSRMIDGIEMDFKPRKKIVNSDGSIGEEGGYYFVPGNPNIQLDLDNGTHIIEGSVLDVLVGVFATVPTLFE